MTMQATGFSTKRTYSAKQNPFLSYQALTAEERISKSCHHCPALKAFGHCPLWVIDDINVAKFLCPGYIDGFS